MSVRKYNFVTGVETSTFPTAENATGDADIAPFSQLNTLFSTAGGTVNYLASDDSAFNSSIGNWVAYADAAAASPVNGVDGAPTTTVTQTTVTPLRGSGSGLITKPASNVQGEGASVDFTIDLADRGKEITVTFDYEMSANLVVGESSDYRVFIYNKDSASLITPNFNYFQTAKGVFTCKFISDANDADYRLIIHCATTNASSGTVEFDNATIGPNSKVQGAFISDWYDGALSVCSWNANETVSSKWRRVGSHIQVQAKVSQSGAPNSAALYFKLGTQFAIDFGKLLKNSGNNLTSVGHGLFEDDTPREHYQLSVDVDHDNSQLQVRTYRADVSDTKLQDVTETNPVTVGSGDSVTIWVELPIVGWDATQALTNNSIYRMSNILVNGTQLTGGTAAASLGEYRTFIKNSSSDAGAVDTSAASVSTADGMLIHSDNYATAGTAGQPNRWEIFVGKNKAVRLEFYKDTGKANALDPQMQMSNTDTYVVGTRHSYDSTSGILYVDTMSQDSDCTNRSCGTYLTGASGFQVGTDAYFDVIVTDPVATFASENNPDSEVYVYAGNGHGSTNNKIRRFTSSSTTGSAISYTDSSANGGSFTIEENGMYSISYRDNKTTAGAFSFGLSLNSSQLTTSIESITDADRLQASQGDQIATSCSVTKRLSIGDVIRAHTDGAADATGSNATIVRITKIAD